jgi:hypothetical protein
VRPCRNQGYLPIHCNHPFDDSPTTTTASSPRMKGVIALCRGVLALTRQRSYFRPVAASRILSPDGGAKPHEGRKGEVGCDFPGQAGVAAPDQRTLSDGEPPAEVAYPRRARRRDGLCAQVRHSVADPAGTTVGRRDRAAAGTTLRPRRAGGVAGGVGGGERDLRQAAGAVPAGVGRQPGAARASPPDRRGARPVAHAQSGNRRPSPPHHA